MNNYIILTYFVNILPKLTLSFVGILLLYKFYYRLRSKYGIRVNCWFCNTNSKVPYLEANSWICKNCEQYNGFNKEGDYNREIKEQFECSSKSTLNDSNPWYTESAPQNGFCDSCNEAQRLKVEKLSQFEPKKESRFDEELKIYKAELEQQYRLCATCDRHLKSVLRNKKKMVLGSKFLEYIMKSAEAFKDPHAQNIRLAQQILWKRRLSLLVTVLTLINLVCLIYVLPALDRAWFENLFGQSIGTQLFILCSHLVALWRVLLSFVAPIMENGTLTRFGLFARTIFMMLLYSLGLRLPQIVRLNFSSIYLLAAPFSILATIFSYNVIDRFKLTRYTVLLALWSVYAGGLLEESASNVHQWLMIFACIVTTLLTATSKVENSPKLFDRTASSFHKLYADDCASDLDTAGSSTLDYQLDCSSLSAPSDISRSFASLKRSTLHPCDRKSPLSSSTYSLNLTPRPNVPIFGMKSPITSSTFSLNQTPLQDNHLRSNASIFYNNDGHNTIRPRMSNSVLNSTFAVSNPFNTSSHNFTQIEKASSPFFTANNSFMQTSHNQSRLHTPMRSGQQLFQNPAPMPAPSLRSAFSASTTALLNMERPSRLLSPSRLSLQPHNVGFASSSSSLNANVGSIYEQAKDSSSHIMRPCSNLSAINESLSRASSRSSGFESQNGLLNNSRENSQGSMEPAVSDLQNKTFSLDNSRSFQPIDYSQVNNGGIDNTFSLLSLTQPLSVNCSSAWQPSPSSRSNLFNPPSLKRGDLLRKWKEGGVVMT